MDNQETASKKKLRNIIIFLTIIVFIIIGVTLSILKYKNRSSSPAESSEDMLIYNVNRECTELLQEENLSLDSLKDTGYSNLYTRIDSLETEDNIIDTYLLCVPEIKYKDGTILFDAIKSEKITLPQVKDELGDNKRLLVETLSALSENTEEEITDVIPNEVNNSEESPSSLNDNTSPSNRSTKGNTTSKNTTTTQPNSVNNDQRSTKEQKTTTQPQPTSCTPKKFDFSWVRADFTSESSCRAKGDELNQKYNGRYDCSYFVDDCGTSYWMLFSYLDINNDGNLISIGPNWKNY